MKKQKNLLWVLAICAITLIAITACDSTTSTPINTSFTLTSDAVVNGVLQAAYHCDTVEDTSVTPTKKTDQSLPLAWSNVPAGTQSLAAVMTNPDSNSVYLVLQGIKPTVTSIARGAAANGSGNWYLGPNKDSTTANPKIGYTSPCSPAIKTDNYEITLYALSATPTTLPTTNDAAVTKTVLETAIATVTTLGTTKLSFFYTVKTFNITVTATSNTAYILSGEDRTGTFTNASNRSLEFASNDTINFIINSGTAHPFHIIDEVSRSDVLSGIITNNNGSTSGTNNI